MASLTKQRMTVGEFLVWAEAQAEGRYELVKGEVVRMAPERVRHNLGKAEVWVVLRDAVRAAGLANMVFTDGMGVVIDEDGTCREPDAIVATGTDYDPDTMTVDDPLIVVEVISPTSQRTDAIDKLAEYFSVPSVRHYVLVWQVEGRIDHHLRDAAGQITHTALKAGATLRLDPPGIDVEVAALLGAAAG